MALPIFLRRLAGKKITDTLDCRGSAWAGTTHEASTAFLKAKTLQSCPPILMRPRKSSMEIPRLLPSTVMMVPPSGGPWVGLTRKISGPGHCSPSRLMTALVEKIKKKKIEKKSRYCRMLHKTNWRILLNRKRKLIFVSNLK